MWKFIKNLFTHKSEFVRSNDIFWIGDYCFNYEEEVLDENNAIYKLIGNNSKDVYIVKKIDNRYYLIIDKECIINIPINKIGITNC